MSAAGPQHVTAVFAQYGDMHSAHATVADLIDLAPIAELGLKPLSLAITLRGLGFNDLIG